MRFVSALGSNFNCYTALGKKQSLERTGFLETLLHDATTTTGVLSSIGRSSSLHMSDLEPDLESDNVVYIINIFQIF